MHTLPRNSAGQTLFLFFASFTRSKSALCHLICEATCSLGNGKQLRNVTSVVEYSKIVTAQHLGDRIMHIIHIFWRIMHISRLISNMINKLRKLIQMIIKTKFFFVGEVISKTRASCFIRFRNVVRCLHFLAHTNREIRPFVPGCFTSP